MLTACGIETILNVALNIIITAVATVLTACGIETYRRTTDARTYSSLQQCLPLAVLKRSNFSSPFLQLFWVATVFTACGIETHQIQKFVPDCEVATVLTACGIETIHGGVWDERWSIGLQQCLPLAVLKHQELKQLL